MTWHAHEMVFGFAMAVLAGFLLTAVGNWTGRETLVGTPLIAHVRCGSPGASRWRRRTCCRAGVRR